MHTTFLDGNVPHTFIIVLCTQNCQVLVNHTHYIMHTKFGCKTSKAKDILQNEGRDRKIICFILGVDRF